MKKVLLAIGGIILTLVLIVGYEINSGLNDFEETFRLNHNLNDSNFILLNSGISPNGQFQFFEYHFDHGGFGCSRAFWSVIENDSIMTDLEKGLLPDGYKAIGWTTTNELVVEKWEPYYYKSEEVALTNKSFINGVKLKMTTLR